MAYVSAIQRSFANVDVSHGINTDQFLEAAEGMVSMFDLIGSTAFLFVQNDMRSNIKRLREQYTSDPSANDTLEHLLATEMQQSKRIATEGLLWLIRLENPQEELVDSFTRAYQVTLRQHHNFLVRPVFSLAVKACPYRKDFYESIGVVEEKAIEDMKGWLRGIDDLVGLVNVLWKEHPYYIKGL
ncbi:glycolipid transfer protein domain-containing protein [Spinellus fusiger]|nr:glycolipid transfer protein domain-containing protein [Spinellus fusiger]